MNRWMTAALLSFLGTVALAKAPLTPLEQIFVRLHSPETIRSATMPTGAPQFFSIFEANALFSDEAFPSAMERLKKEKPKFMTRQLQLLQERYDLSDHPSSIRMTRGKPIQTGIRVRLPAGVSSWEALARMDPATIRDRDLFPGGFLALPHVKQEEGGQVFPKMHIDELKRQTGRDLTRFDVDFDIPEHFLPEEPAAIYIRQREDLGDVSQGKVLTTDNFFEIMDKHLTSKQTDGLRLLLTPFAEQQFNLTSDRRSERPSLGVSCFDCHQNGHTNGAFHLVGDSAPNPMRNRVDTPTLRGVGFQRLFGSQRLLKSVEDFTEFEQRAIYFDGKIEDGIRKGVNTLARDQVADMGEMQDILDFPPAPKLDQEGRLIHALATPQEIRGETVFFGKAKCATCHEPPFYTDNSAHDLGLERFYKTGVTFNGLTLKPEGFIKTFPLRGIKDSPPYLHDGRLLTLDDAVEFFNLVTGTELTKEEKQDLVAFLRTL